MRTPGASVARSPTHVFQRMLDSIPFLLLLGVGFPTLLYTVWSVVELQQLTVPCTAPSPRVRQPRPRPRQSPQPREPSP
jgi:hypothetical protein